MFLRLENYITLNASDMNNKIKDQRVVKAAKKTNPIVFHCTFINCTFHVFNKTKFDYI